MCFCKEGRDVLKKQNIICTSTMYWDDLWTRKQRFMEMLSKEGNKVLYVEPFSWVVGITFFAKLKWILKKIILEPAGKLKIVSGNLYVLSPSISVPFKRKFYFAAVLNGMVLKWQIKRIMGKLRFCCPILWIYNPFDTFLIGGFNEKVVVYDCVDEHSAYPAFKQGLLRTIEKKLVKKSNVVFVTSSRLYEEKKLLNKNTFYIPNGVDFEFFRNAVTNKKVPEDIAVINKPIIGWLGAVRSWLDFDLIQHISETNPKWSIVFVGPVIEKLDLESLKKLKNVFFLGKKTKEEVPAYLQNFDVCLIPNKINELTNAMNPIKIYEYLAVGKPVVAVNLCEVRQLADVVKIANNREEFVGFIKDSLYTDDDDKEQVLKRIKKAESYSWNSLFNKAIRHIEKVLSNG